MDTQNNDTDTDSDNETLSHEELMQVTSSTLAKILPQDPFLSDLPTGVTLEEVNSQIALQFGRSMTVYLLREDDDELPIVVPQGTATVLDLKHAFQRYMALRMLRQKLCVKISWKHVWRTHWLVYGSQPLNSDSQLLSSFNIHNRSRVKFSKRLRKRDRNGTR